MISQSAKLQLETTKDVLTLKKKMTKYISTLKLFKVVF